MGLALAKTGSVSFSQLNDSILQTTTTTQLDMATAGVRLGYPSGTTLSMSNFRGGIGFQVTSATWTYVPGSKFVAGYWTSQQILLTGAYDGLYMQTSAYIASDIVVFPYYSGAPGGYYGANNVTRAVSNNVTRTYSIAAADTTGYMAPSIIGESPPPSNPGTITFGFVFG
jgi:hypothetical protein